eukprot:TRINITY_DN17908_c0_g1_i1.p1 TRINITY_DN17908_c0_g1~~TRINITY_DN17908_c0_g1_i1.p1  ORF type:complete len:887 (+),score=156.99 TRINITY_DN17908_c0_g1_i1:106-2766(+)
MYERQKTTFKSFTPGFHSPTNNTSTQNSSYIRTIGNYDVGKTIGKGQFGKVKIAHHILTGEEVAIKIIDKNKLDEASVKLVRREISIMKLLNHKNIIQLYEVLEADSAFYLIMEHACGGQISETLLKGRLDENKAAFFFSQIVEALQYCHKHRVVHRDLKIENLLFDSDHNIKIIDFGLSNMISPGEKLNTFCGSPNYAAPELILKQEYFGPEVDIWSLGVVLYVFVCGRLPFNESDFFKLYAKILKSDYVLPGYISPDCRSLLERMLVVDPLTRATLDEIISHQWLASRQDSLASPLPLSLGEPTSPTWTPSNAEEIDEEVLRFMETLGFMREEVTEALLKNSYNAATATYLLLTKKIGKEKHHRSRQRYSRSFDTSPGPPNSRGSPGLPRGGRHHRRNKTLDTPPPRVYDSKSPSPLLTPEVIPSSPSTSPPAVPSSSGTSSGGGGGALGLPSLNCTGPIPTGNTARSPTSRRKAFPVASGYGPGPVGVATSNSPTPLLSPPYVPNNNSNSRNDFTKTNNKPSKSCSPPSSKTPSPLSRANSAFLTPVSSRSQADPHSNPANQRPSRPNPTDSLDNNSKLWQPLTRSNINVTNKTVTNPIVPASKLRSSTSSPLDFASSCSPPPEPPLHRAYSECAGIISWNDSNPTMSPRELLVASTSPPKTPTQLRILNERKPLSLSSCEPHGNHFGMSSAASPNNPPPSPKKSSSSPGPLKTLFSSWKSWLGPSPKSGNGNTPAPSWANQNNAGGGGPVYGSCLGSNSRERAFSESHATQSAASARVAYVAHTVKTSQKSASDLMANLKETLVAKGVSYHSLSPSCCQCVALDSRGQLIHVEMEALPVPSVGDQPSSPSCARLHYIRTRRISGDADACRALCHEIIKLTQF